MAENEEKLTNETADTEGSAANSVSADDKEKVKHDNFTRLATSRTNKVLTALSHLGNCSSRSSYSYSDEEVEKIFGAIQSKVDETRAKFAPKVKKEEEAFTL